MQFYYMKFMHKNALKTFRFQSRIFNYIFKPSFSKNPDGQRFRNVRIFHDDDRIVEGAGARWSFVDAFGCTS